MRIRLLLNSSYTLALLTGLYPALFFISNNWFAIGLRQSIYLVLALTLIAFIVVSLASLILNKVVSWYRLCGSEMRAQSSHFIQALERGFVFFLSCYLLLGFLQFTLTGLAATIHLEDLRNGILFALAVVLLVYLIGAGHSKTEWLNPIVLLNFFLLIMSFLAFASLSMSVLGNYDKLFRSASLDNTEKQEVYVDVNFASTPNIYLIIPDSYPSNPLLARLFGFDNSDFSNELSRAGFSLYDDYFSSYPYSVQSMHSMFSMEHNYFRNSIGEDTLNMRKLIAGRGNNVTDILRNNGYTSHYIHESDYLVQENCFIESCLPRLSDYQRFRQILENFYFFDFDGNTYKYDVGTAMTEQIASTQQDSRRFIYKHFMDAHSGLKSYDKRNEGALEGFRRNYPARIKQVNKVLLGEIEKILAHDQTAVIVIVADHGTWAGAERTNAGLTSDETLDKVNVFLAIRWGSAYRGQYEHDIKTSVNLFRYLFAYLSNDERILATKVEDDSYVKYRDVWKVVEDGKVLAQPKQYGQNTSE